MKKPHLEVTQNDKSGLYGKCSSCDEYFTIGGPGLARNPEAATQLNRILERRIPHAPFPQRNHAKSATRISREMRDPSPQNP